MEVKGKYLRTSLRCHCLISKMGEVGFWLPTHHVTDYLGELPVGEFVVYSYSQVLDFGSPWDVYSFHHYRFSVGLWISFICYTILSGYRCVTGVSRSLGLVAVIAKFLQFRRLTSLGWSFPTNVWFWNICGVDEIQFWCEFCIL